MNSMKKPHTAENGDLIHTTEDNEASDISIITISFVRKTKKQKEIIALEKKSDWKHYNVDVSIKSKKL